MRSRLLSGWGALIVALLLALLAPRHAAASEPPARISVLTMGPGDHPFTRFGHNALLLEWSETSQRKSLVYNYGTFEFDGLRGVQDFMAGRFRYWLSVSSLDSTLRSYGAARRSLRAQELELSESERAQLFSALADNALPEHRYYDYDYYRDNCSTRVRDALDRLLGGQLRREVTGPGRLSFRQHTLRLTQDGFWLYLGLDLALGAPTDRPTTRWEELFLPEELHDELGRATRQVEGRAVPLVRAERSLLTAVRAPSAQQAPERAPLLGAGGVLLGSLLALLGARAPRRRAWRIAFGSVTALLGTALGLLGTALALFASSKHWAAHQNRSLLACPPWALALLVLGVLFALGRRGANRPLLVVLAASLGTSVVLLALSLAPASRESLRSAALFVPVWAGWFYGAWRATCSSQR
ncbi:MAG TPA: DUF4105 domain-containing protein [Polyangiaceae bacterium]|nr:DUF4105 domain-containing protein [Polyangiaceae bacterium]